LRRAAAVIGLVAVIGSLCLTGLAHDDWESYADEFKSISYSRDDGTLDWASDWTEVNDDGTVSGGDVHVANDSYCADDPCLNLYASILQLQPIAAQRCADTSVFANVEISFDMRRRFPLVLGPTLRVKVSTNGGGSWTTIATYPLNVNDGSVQHKVITGDWISEEFMLRFEGSGLLNGEVFIDNVVVTGEPAETGTTTTSSTTTTTKPTTTTTSDATTTTTRPTTTTTGGGTTSTSVGSTTSTTVPGVSTTTVPGQTTTTDDRSTTTTLAPGGNGGPPPGPDGPGNHGLRDTGTGIQGNFQASLFGELAPMVAVEPVGALLDYKTAVEVIEASWGWMLLLGGVIAWSVIKGLDRRKVPPGARAVPEP
jgi:hypothetical protein